MTKKNRLAILTRAREILSEPKNWTRGALRRKKRDGYGYCVLGACEQAAYDLGLAEPQKTAFRTAQNRSDVFEGIGYSLGHELSLQAFSRETRRDAVTTVNDYDGYKAIVQLLDEYILEVKAGRPRPQKGA